MCCHKPPGAPCLRTAGLGQLFQPGLRWRRGWLSGPRGPHPSPGVQVSSPCRPSRPCSLNPALPSELQMALTWCVCPRGTDVLVPRPPLPPGLEAPRFLPLGTSASLLPADSCFQAHLCLHGHLGRNADIASELPVHFGSTRTPPGVRDMSRWPHFKAFSCLCSSCVTKRCSSLRPWKDLLPRKSV